MWAAIKLALPIVWSIVKSLFGIGAVDERDKAEETGERVGSSETKAADQSKVLTDVEKANEVRQSVDASLNTHPDRVRDTDGFRRD